MKQILYPVLLHLLLALPGSAQQVAILRPSGKLYQTIRPKNQVNLTYQQTPFLQVNYSVRVADITADTLFVVDKRLGLLGLAVDKIVGLQRVRYGTSLAITLGGIVVIGVAGGRLLRAAGLTSQTVGAYLSRVVITSAGITGATLITRLVFPRKPRIRLDRGYTFRPTGAYQ